MSAKSALNRVKNKKAKFSIHFLLIDT